MKKMKNIVSLTLAASILGSSTVSFALPENTLVIGNKAFEVFALADNSFDEEINEALSEAEVDEIYYKLEGDADEYKSIIDEADIKPEEKEKISNLVYKSADRLEIVYDKFDDETGTAKVANREELEKHMKSDLVDSIELKEEIDLGEEPLSIEKAIKIKLNGKKIKGNVEIKVKNSEEKVEIEDASEGEGGIDGELNVLTKNAEVVLNARVQKVKAEKEFKLVAGEKAMIEEVSEEVKAKIEVKKEDGSDASTEDKKEVFGKKPEKKPERPTRPVYVNYAPTGRSVTIDLSKANPEGGEIVDANLVEIFTDRNGDALTYNILEHDGLGNIMHNGRGSLDNQAEKYENMTRFMYMPKLDGENPEYGKIVTVLVTANDGVNTSSPVAIKFKCPEKPKMPEVEVTSDSLEQFEDAEFEFRNVVSNRDFELLNGDYYVLMVAERVGPILQKRITFKEGEAELSIDGPEFQIYGELNLIFDISKEEHPMFGGARPVGGFMPAEAAMPVEAAVPAKAERIRKSEAPREALKLELAPGSRELVEVSEDQIVQPVESPIVARLQTRVNIEQSSNHKPVSDRQGHSFVVYAGIENQLELSNAFYDEDGDELEIEPVEEGLANSEIDFTEFAMQDGDTALFTPSTDDIGENGVFPFVAFDGKQYSQVSPVEIRIVSKDNLISSLTESITNLSTYVLTEADYYDSTTLLEKIDAAIVAAKNMGITDQEISEIEGYEKIALVRAELPEFEADLEATEAFEHDLYEFLAEYEGILVNESTLELENGEEFEELIVIYGQLSERAQNLIEDRALEKYQALEEEYFNARDAFEGQLDDIIDQMNQTYGGYQLYDINIRGLEPLQVVNEIKAAFEALPSEFKEDLDDEYQAIVDKFYAASDALNAKKQEKIQELETLAAVFEEEITKENFIELRTTVNVNYNKIIEIVGELNFSDKESMQYIQLYENKVNDIDVFTSHMNSISDMKNALRDGFNKETGTVINEGAMEYLVTKFESISEGARALLTDEEIQDMERAIEAFKAAREEAKAQQKADLISQIKTLAQGLTYELTPETIADTEVRYRDIYAQIASLLNPTILSDEELNNIAEYQIFLDQGEEIRIYSLNRRNADEVVNEIKAQYVSDALTIAPENLSAVKAALSKYDAQSDEVKAVYTAEENAVVEGARAAVAEFEAQA